MLNIISNPRENEKKNADVRIHVIFFLSFFPPLLNVCVGVRA